MMFSWGMLNKFFVCILVPENLATGVCFCDNEYEPDENLWINKYRTFTPLHLACIAGISTFSKNPVQISVSIYNDCKLCAIFI